MAGHISKDGNNAAKRLKDLFIEVSPIIEYYTSGVCPRCTDVCCRQKHSVFSDRDKLFLAALGIGPPSYDSAPSPDGSCPHLGAAGCERPRWLRPWRCTGFFCEALIAAIEEGPPREARRLFSALEEMTWLYGEINVPHPESGPATSPPRPQPARRNNSSSR